MKKKAFIIITSVVSIYLILFLLSQFNLLNTTTTLDNDTAQEKTSVYEQEQASKEGQNVFTNGYDNTADLSRTVLIVYVVVFIVSLILSIHYKVYQNPTRGIQKRSGDEIDQYLCVAIAAVFSICIFMWGTDRIVDNLAKCIENGKMVKCNAPIFYGALVLLYRIWQNSGINIIIEIFIVSKVVKCIYELWRKGEKHKSYDELGNYLTVCYIYAIILAIIIIVTLNAWIQRDNTIILVDLFKYLAVFIGGFYWFDKDISKKYRIILNNKFEKTPSVVFIIIPWAAELYIITFFLQDSKLFGPLLLISFFKVIIYFGYLFFSVNKHKKYIAKICHISNNTVNNNGTLIVSHKVRYEHIPGECKFVAESTICMKDGNNKLVDKNNPIRKEFYVNDKNRDPVLTFNFELKDCLINSTVYFKDNLYTGKQLKPLSNNKIQEYTIKISGNNDN